ncbi:MAG: 30S ribosome-binding factor RbfA [Fibrobacter sp.]|nr:30S ribosome-binding factor RbfA [Fibrobacter sp.]
MPSLHYHMERLSELLQREIGLVISQELRDPRVPALVTVTSIKLAQDTRNATVYVSIYGDQQTKDTAVAALNGAAPFIQKLVSSRVTVKHFPRLYFKIDNSIERGQHINELLKEIQNDLE